MKQPTIKFSLEAVEYGQWLRKKRREAGMTIEDLAGELGLSKGAVSKWEIGERMPKRAYQTVLKRMFSGEQDFYVKEEERELIRAYRANERHTKEIVMIMLKTHAVEKKDIDG